MIIYKVTNLTNNKIYIGQTINSLTKRRKQHEDSVKYQNTGCRVFTNALKKYGIENFKWEIIDTANSIEELNNKETYWINRLHSFVDLGNGYNLTTGGGNTKLSNETKRMIGEAQIGELNHMFGKKGENNHTSKPVINISDNIAYVNATQCSELENVSLSKICAVCRGDRATANYKIYRYLDDEGNIIEPIVKMKQKSKSVINIDTGLLYKTVHEAELSQDKNSNNLATALRQGNGVCYWNGSRWKYADIKDEVNPKKKIRRDSKKVKNITTGVIYDSIGLAAESINKNYRNLATSLRKGNGKCKWNKYEWEIIN